MYHFKVNKKTYGKKFFSRFLHLQMCLTYKITTKTKLRKVCVASLLKSNRDKYLLILIKVYIKDNRFLENNYHFSIFLQ
jgi:hypothetical protein